MKDCDWKVYKHTGPDGMSYVGITSCRPSARWARGKGYADNKEFYEYIQRVGWDNIRHEVLLRGLDEATARDLERNMIVSCKTMWPLGFNHVPWQPPRVSLEVYREKRRRKLKYYGTRFGAAVVIDYWPGSDGLRECLYQCDCGKEFVFSWKDAYDNDCFDCGCGCGRSREENSHPTG